MYVQRLFVLAEKKFFWKILIGQKKKKNLFDNHKRSEIITFAQILKTVKKR